MVTMRQDAWTEEEDMLLSEIVLRHIREGRTQLEAFKQAADSLSRTAAACGFRWNAGLRKRHLQAVELAKEKRKARSTQKLLLESEDEQETIDSVISMLEKVRHKEEMQRQNLSEYQMKRLRKLEEENNLLQKRLHRYEEAWEEIGKVWAWIDGQHKGLQKENEH